MIFDANSATSWQDANIRCFEDINMLDRGYAIDEAQITEILKFIDGRNEYSDGSMLCILKALAHYSYALSPEIIADIKHTVLNFKYRIDEPGCEDIRYWPESRRLSFAAAEYIAGRLYPEEVFRVSKMSGHRHMKKGEQALRLWFKQRFLYGFSQWHSPEAYERNIAALTLLVDCTGDSEITRSAEIILDLLFFEIALNCFNGRYVAVCASSGPERKENPALCGLNDILRNAFEFDVLGSYDYRRLSSIFILRKKYELPPIFAEIAQSRSSYIIKESMGLDASEIKTEFPDTKNIEETGMFLWGMGSMTNTPSIEISVRLLNKYRLHTNRYLKILKPFNNPVIRGLRLYSRAVRIANPLSKAETLSRANVYTFKTDRYMLSTAQKYLPGEYGPCRHVWQASMPKDINIFTVCPAPEGITDDSAYDSPMDDNSQVPDGITLNPHAAQFESVVLCAYKAETRSGGKNASAFSYLHFPFGSFDDAHADNDFVCGVVENSFVGVKSIGDLEQVSDNRFTQNGRTSAYAVILADSGEFASLGSFISFFRKCVLSFRNNRLIFDAPNWHYDRYELEYGGDFFVSGQKIQTEHDRFETPFAYAPRKPKEIDISFNTGNLRLNLEQTERQQG